MQVDQKHVYIYINDVLMFAINFVTACNLQMFYFIFGIELTFNRFTHVVFKDILNFFMMYLLFILIRLIDNGWFCIIIKTKSDLLNMLMSNN